jgi:rhamnosyltransferase
MKIIPIVVWYNPESLGRNKAIENIQTYSNHFERIIIIDNSSISNHDIASKIVNSIYIANNENFGIAKALNQGCERAIEMGYDWILTMDQDSSWEDTYLALYISEIKKLYLENEKNISFSPKNIVNNCSILGSIKHKLFPVSYHDYQLCDRIGTSGNILKLDILQALNGFKEELFIDEVDYDFCYRLRKQGYNIIRIFRCCMNHVVGKNKKYFFPHACQHNKERVYYRIRNMLYIKKKHALYYKKYHYQQIIIRIILEKCFSFQFSDLKYAYKGFKDEKNNRYGKYE